MHPLYFGIDELLGPRGDQNLFWLIYPTSEVHPQNL